MGTIGAVNEFGRSLSICPLAVPSYCEHKIITHALSLFHSFMYLFPSEFAIITIVISIFIDLLICTLSSI